MATHDSPSIGRRAFIAGSAGTALAGTAGCLGSLGGGGGSFPSQDISMIIPFGTGGGFDTYARLAAKFLPDHLPNEVNVNPRNVEGGGGEVGLERTMNADPDGHTAMIMWLDGFAKRQVRTDVDWDARDMTFYPQVAKTISTFCVGTNSGIETWDDYVAKVENDDITYGSAGGIDASGALVPALLGRMSGLYSVEFVGRNTVTFEARGASISAVQRGDVDVIVSSQGSTAQYIEAGSLRRISTFAVGDEKQTDLVGDIQNFQELGVLNEQQFNQLRALSSTNRAFGGPPGVPDDIAETWRTALTDTIQSEEYLNAAEEAQRAVAYFSADEARQTYNDLITTWEENEDVLETLAEAHGSS